MTSSLLTRTPNVMGSLVPKVGVSQREIDKALEALKTHSHHEIPDVKIKKGFLSSLGS